MASDETVHNPDFHLDGDDESYDITTVNRIAHLSLDDDKQYRMYASESETGARRTRCRRERCVSRAWDMRRCCSGRDRRRRGSPEGDLECRLMVRPKGRKERICMDLEEVKACKDLGLALPKDWTVEISGDGADTSSGGSSPMSNWCISSPGDDPREIKARLKVWAQAVALASSSSRLTQMN